MFEQRAAEEAALLQFADCRTLMKSVVTLGLDGVENSKTAAAEHFEIDAKAAVDHFCKRQALGEKGTSSPDEIPHEADIAVVETPPDDIVLSETSRGGSVERDVDAAFFEVA